MRALVALTHCLVVDLSDRFDRGEKLPTMPPWHVQENKWRAARYGLDAWIILDEQSNERLMQDDLHELMEHLAPVAERLGCAADLALVDEIVRGGASYQRQRQSPRVPTATWSPSSTPSCASCSPSVRVRDQRDLVGRGERVHAGDGEQVGQQRTHLRQDDLRREFARSLDL